MRRQVIKGKAYLAELQNVVRHVQCKQRLFHVFFPRKAVIAQLIIFVILKLFCMRRGKKALVISAQSQTASFPELLVSLCQNPSHQLSASPWAPPSVPSSCIPYEYNSNLPTGYSADPYKCVITCSVFILLL